MDTEGDAVIDTSAERVCEDDGDAVIELLTRGDGDQEEWSDCVVENEGDGDIDTYIVCVIIGDRDVVIELLTETDGVQEE